MMTAFLPKETQTYADSVFFNIGKSMFEFLGTNIDLGILLIVMIMPLFIWASLNNQKYGMFIYANKRRKDVSLHLRPCKTPRNPSGSPRIMSSLRNVIRELKRKGYESATFESHLIDDRAMQILQKLAIKENVVLLPAVYKHTPLVFRVIIPLTTLFCKIKLMSTNKISAVVRFQLQPERDTKIFLGSQKGL